MSEWIRAIYRKEVNGLFIENAPRISGRYLVTCYEKGMTSSGFYEDMAYYSTVDRTWKSSDKKRMMKNIVAYMDAPYAYSCDDIFNMDEDNFLIKKKPLYINHYLFYNIQKIHELISLQHNKTGKFEMELATYSYQDDNLDDVIIYVYVIEKDGCFSVRFDKVISRIKVNTFLLPNSFELFGENGIINTLAIEKELNKYVAMQIPMADVENFRFVSNIKKLNYDDIVEALITGGTAAVLAEAYYDIHNTNYMIEIIPVDTGDDFNLLIKEYVEERGIWKNIHKYQMNLCLEDIYMNLATNLEKEARVYAGMIH